MADPVFVFGSNLAGRHGKGAAQWARYHRGARYGVGVGPTGNAYAIPTKGRNLEPLSLQEIRAFVADFLAYARANPDKRFHLTPIGCGLAGYKPDQIAPMFTNAPDNVIKPPEFGGPANGSEHADANRPRTGTTVRAGDEIAFDRRDA